MNVTTDIILFFIGQSIVIIGAMLIAYIKLRIALNTCEVGMEHINATTTRIDTNYTTLSEKVDGISRHVSEIEGKLA